MNIKKGILIFVIFFLNFARSHADPISQAAAFHESGCDCDVHFAKTLAEELRSDLSDTPESFAKLEIHSDFESFEKRHLELEGIINSYNDEISKSNLLNNAARIAELGVKEVVSTAADIAYLTGPKVVIAKTIKVGAEFAAEKARQHLADNLSKANQIVLGERLRKYRITDPDLSSLVVVGGENPSDPGAALYQTLFGNSIIYDDRFRNIDPAHQHIVSQSMVRTLADAFANQTFESIANYKQHQNEIEKNKTKIAKISRLINSHLNKKISLVNSIQKNQNFINYELKKIVGSISNNTNEISKNKRKLLFVQQTLFGKLSPREQLAALENGFLSDRLTDSERAELISHRKVLVARQQLVSDVGKYLNEANAIAEIANDLNLDSSIVQPISRAASIGNAAMKAFTAFSSGNYFQAASAITGLFSSKKDIAADRHEQLVGMLQHVIGKLEVIDKKLDRLWKGQIAIIQNQKLIMAQIKELRAEVENKFQNLFSSIYELHKDVLWNRKLIVDTVRQKIQVCYDAILDRELGFDKRIGEFPKFNQVIELIAKHNLVRNGICLETLQEHFAGSGNISYVFNLKNYKLEPGTPDPSKNKSQIDSFERFVFNPTRDLLLLSSKINAQSSDSLIASLFLPVDNVFKLNKKSIEIKTSASFPANLRTKFRSVVDTPLSTEAVQTYGIALLNLHSLIQFLNIDSSVISRSDMLHNLRGGTSASASESLLERAIEIVDVAIAQQNLTSGDLLLPLIDKILVNGFHDQRITDTFADEYKVFQIFKHNKLFLKNYLVYKIDNMLRKQGGWAGSYFIAYSGSSETVFHKVLGSQQEFVPFREAQMPVWQLKRNLGDPLLPNYSRWYVVWGDQQLPLPDPIEISGGNLEFPFDLDELVSLRSQLTSELLGYDFLNKEKGKLTPAQLRLVTGAMLHED